MIAALSSIHDRCWRRLRRRDAVEGQDLVAGDTLLGQRRQVRRQRRTLARRDAERAHLAAPDQRQKDGDALEGQLDRATEHRAHRLSAAAIGHADEINTGLRFEQLRGEMRQAARASMCIIELAPVGLGVSEKLRERLRRERRQRHQDLKALRNLGDRREVVDGMVACVGRHRRKDGEYAGIAGEQHITVSRSAGDCLGADCSASARPILDNDRLPEPRRQDQRGESRRHVGWAARRCRHDDFDRFVRIVLCLRRDRDAGDYCSERSN